MFRTASPAPGGAPPKAHAETSLAGPLRMETDRPLLGEHPCLRLSAAGDLILQGNANANVF